MKTKARPGRHGFKLVNPELLEDFNTMFEACMAECDLELLPLQAHIAQLKQLLLSTDAQIPHIGLAPKERNRWVQQCSIQFF